VLAAAAVLLASINVFGGFAVTRRMLQMFVKALSADTSTPAKGSHR